MIAPPGTIPPWSRRGATFDTLVKTSDVGLAGAFTPSLEPALRPDMPVPTSALAGPAAEQSRHDDAEGCR